jgi:nitrate reductase assembly molybdenum cofactor insertion protein NarJ
MTMQLYVTYVANVKVEVPEEFLQLFNEGKLITKEDCDSELLNRFYDWCAVKADAVDRDDAEWAHSFAELTDTGDNVWEV